MKSGLSAIALLFSVASASSICPAPILTLDPTDPNSQVNGPGGVYIWDTGYDGLSYFGYAIAGGSPWLSEIRFTP
jgi:hypothetical protein